MIVGDSIMIIQKCVKLSENEHLLEDESSIMIKIIYLFKRIEKVDLYHVLWANNHLVDGQANAGVALKQDVLSINQVVKEFHIP